MKEKNQIPSKDILNKSLRDLEKSKGIDPENYRVMLWSLMDSGFVCVCVC